MANITCLRDYIHAHGLKKQPPCFYCGMIANQIDHIRPRTKRGSSSRRNINPSCERCNKRKLARTINAFRATLERLAEAQGRRVVKIRFYGEGARGAELHRLRSLLSMHYRRGKIVVAPPGAVFAPLDEKTRERNKERKARNSTIRWMGRFTFKGFRAIRDLSKKTGCTFPVIERFVMGHPTQSDDKLKKAVAELGLNVAALRALKPLMAR